MMGEDQSKNVEVLNVDALEFQTRIGPIGVYSLPQRSGLLFKTRMNSDADGAPNAYHPTNNSIALDYLPNAGKPGNWWGVVTDTGKRDGKPVVQTERDPHPGYYVSATSLADGSKSRTNPLRSVNSEHVPYIALPKEIINACGVRLGDLAIVVRGSSVALSCTIFADGGPSGKLGEGSVALAKALGIPSSAKNGGTAKRDVIYLVFPGSRSQEFLTRQQIETRARGLFEQWGGMGQLRACFENNDLSKPLEAELTDRDPLSREPEERPMLEELGESESGEIGG